MGSNSCAGPEEERLLGLTPGKKGKKKATKGPRGAGKRSGEGRNLELLPEELPRDEDN